MWSRDNGAACRPLEWKGEEGGKREESEVRVIFEEEIKKPNRKNSVERNRKERKREKEKSKNIMSCALPPPSHHPVNDHT